MRRSTRRRARCPSGMPPPTYRKVNPADAPIVMIAVQSETLR
jgi:multidrug efflux pump subunit AcrB